MRSGKGKVKDARYKAQGVRMELARFGDRRSAVLMEGLKAQNGKRENKDYGLWIRG